MSGVLTKLQCCPTSDGAAAAVLASQHFVDSNNLRDRVYGWLSRRVGKLAKPDGTF